MEEGDPWWIAIVGVLRKVMWGWLRDFEAFQFWLLVRYRRVEDGSTTRQGHQMYRSDVKVDRESLLTLDN